MDQQQQQQPQHQSIARISAANHDGWLPQLKHWVIGKRDPVEQQLHEVERQGRGMARIMHAAGYLMLVLFSIGSAIGICGTLVERVVANGPLTWQSLPNDVVITVSLMLVFCMDLAAIYAAFHMRLLATRHASWKAYILHVLVLAVCTALEGGTFIQMSFEYDNVIAGTVAALIIARGFVAPLLSVYLNMARAIPSGVADIAYHSFLGAGQGVVRDIIHIANDPGASLAEKAELMAASAYINSNEQAQLDRLIETARRREASLRGRNPAASVPRARIVAAGYASPPSVPPQEHLAYDPRDMLDTHDTYRAMHDGDEDVDYGITDEVYDEIEDESDLFSTLEIPAIRLAGEAADHPDTSSAKRGTRARKNSGPAKANLDRAKAVREYNRKLKLDAKAQRRATIRDAVYAILDEWHAAGRVEQISDRELARRVAKRVDFPVNPSGNTVARWRGPWQSSRAHKAALEAEGAIVSDETMAELESLEPALS